MRYSLTDFTLGISFFIPSDHPFSAAIVDQPIIDWSHLLLRNDRKVVPIKVSKTILQELSDWMKALIFAVPGRVGQALRYQWAKWFLGRFGTGSRLSQGCKIDAARAISLGKDCSVGNACFLSADGGIIEIGDTVSFNVGVHLNASVGGRISIGDNCLFGPNVVIRTANHRFDRLDTPIRYQGHDCGDILIEEDCWIAANVTILPDVTIGRGAVIGAGAVVTRSVPPYSIHAGVPARQVGQRDKKETSQ